jgi:glutamate-1-semialdehyde 2,1-aminomutase
MTTNQNEYFKYANQYLVGGVSSSFRINPFTGQRMYLKRADGPYIYDLDGRRYIDFFMGHGACPLGHNRPEIKEAILKAVDLGFFAEYDTSLTVEFAKKIVEHIPCAELVRYVNSGTEGTLLAMRLARGYTGRNKIVRIDGHFHGGHDYALANNLAGKIDFENKGDRISKIGYLSAGVPEAVRDTIFVIPWNNADVFENLCRAKGNEIAAILMNPIDYNNGCIGTSTEYLQAIRNICNAYGIVMIFDEILSGFRTGIRCAQGYYGVTPDLCLLGKALTNGVPLGAIAGKSEIMMKIMDPIDPVIAGGTYTGSPLGCGAGLAVFKIMETPGFYEEWLARVNTFMNSLQKIFDNIGFPAIVQNIGVNFYIYVGTRDPILSQHDVAKIDTKLAKVFFSKCIEKGLYFHTDFTVSAMHDEKILEEALNKINDVTNDTIKEI